MGSKKRRKLTDEMLYEIARHMAREKGAPDDESTEFAGWEWEKFHATKTRDQRAFFMRNAFFDYCRHRYGFKPRLVPDDKLKRKRVKRMTGRNLKNIELGHLRIEDEAMPGRRFEDSEIYRMARSQEFTMRLDTFDHAIATLMFAWGFTVKELAVVFGVHRNTINKRVSSILKGRKG